MEIEAFVIFLKIPFSFWLLIVQLHSNFFHKIIQTILQIKEVASKFHYQQPKSKVYLDSKSNPIRDHQNPTKPPSGMQVASTNAFLQLKL